MKKPVVFYDLECATLGYGGIAQDARIAYKALAQLEDIDLIGSLSGATRDNFVYSKAFLKKRSDFEEYQHIANAIARSIGVYQPKRKKNNILSKGISLLEQCSYFWRWLWANNRMEYKTFNLPQLNKLIWRSYFSKTLSSSDFKKVFESRFCVSTYSRSATRMKKLYFDNPEVDFYIFHDVTPVKIKHGMKIVRYHDLSPGLDFDTTVNGSTKLHLNDLKGCIRDTFFVCNSEPVREDLISVYPDIAERSAVVPCALASQYARLEQPEAVHKIIQTRASKLHWDGVQMSDVLQSFNTTQMPYILTLSTIEPRKNQLQLIRAWEKLRILKDQDIKLIMVGGLGWKNDEIIQAMKPHIRVGNLFHLEKLTEEEIPYMYSHAKAFVFPSYNEGFGIPPLEAIQCGCPVIASDIRAHRWVMGDAAMYCDPYDIASICDAMQKMLYSDDAQNIQQHFIQKGYEQAKKYSVESVSKKWAELFGRLTKNSKPF
ncbi:MAG: glycosyltransferase family 4 protein [Gammaproteobacteria bacterium]